MAWARLATRFGPTFCISCAVMVFLEYISPSRRVIARPLGAPPSLGRQTPPPARASISTASSIKVSLALRPCSNAAP